MSRASSSRAAQRRPRGRWTASAVLAVTAATAVAAASAPAPPRKTVVADAPSRAAGAVADRPAAERAVGDRAPVLSPPDVIAAATLESIEEAAHEPRPAPPARSVWDDLADCESGLWGPDGVPQPGTARWSYGLTETGLFEGGLQFHPPTWDEFRDPGMPDHAGAATREQQIVVAERVLDAQGWKAWPVCSRKLGLR